MPIECDPEEREIAALVELAPNLRGARVVEVGCGDGRLTRRYAARAGSVFAFDPDHVAIAGLRQDAPPGVVELCVAAVDRVEIPQSSADVVLLSWAL